MTETELARDLAEKAWNATKDDGDPEFSGCIPTHREKLHTHAESVIRTGVAETDFEKKVADLLKPKAKVVDAPEEAQPKKSKSTAKEKETVH